MLAKLLIYITEFASGKSMKFHNWFVLESFPWVKNVLGCPSNGSNGIGHLHIDASAHRAYEVSKVLDQALAYHNDPTPKFKGVNYHGLTVRYTKDVAPIAKIPSAKTEKAKIKQSSPDF